MELRERIGESQDALRGALEGLRAQMWTAIPAVITKVDFATMTVEAQPTIQANVSDPNGVVSLVNLPVLPTMPIVFPRGGGYTLTFPIKEGDECLVVFSARAIDAWWQSGGVQPPIEDRMHDLSDGFALIGPCSQTNLVPNISANTVQLRSDDQQLEVELDSTKGQATVKAPVQIILDTPIVHVTGQLAVDNVHGIASPATVQGSIHVTQNVIADVNVTAGADMLAGPVSARHHTHLNSGGTGVGGPPVGG